MSAAQDIATKARHRGCTPWQLVRKIGRLEREADNSACQLVAMATEVDGLVAERNQLASRLSTTRTELTAARGHIAAVEAELTAVKAHLANVLKVSAPAGCRDIDPDDQPTQPIHVMPLWQALGVGPVRPVTNPGQTSWGQRHQEAEVA